MGLRAKVLLFRAGATFVRLDSTIPQALVPLNMVQMLLSGVAPVVASNWPRNQLAKPGAYVASTALPQWALVRAAVKW